MKKIDIRMFEKESKYVDSYVLLTQQMKEKLGVGDRPFVVVEGTVNLSETMSDPEYNTSGDKQRIVYAGTLKQRFGIMNLVEAIHRIENPNIELMICGRGDAEDEIREFAEKDSRIHLLGQISAMDSAALVASATLLVNPRQNNEEYTKYSFPSKTMEYLLSGIPLIAYELDGMPEDYKEYIYFVGDDSIDALSSKINEVLNIPGQTRREFGLRAREFVMKTKTSGVACEKIMSMILSKVK
jgi:glycosyltransferase involved in cell wall biosynthesis